MRKFSFAWKSLHLVTIILLDNIGLFCKIIQWLYAVLGYKLSTTFTGTKQIGTQNADVHTISTVQYTNMVSTIFIIFYPGGEGKANSSRKIFSRVGGSVGRYTAQGASTFSTSIQKHRGRKTEYERKQKTKIKFIWWKTDGEEKCNNKQELKYWDSVAQRDEDEGMKDPTLIFPLMEIFVEIFSSVYGATPILLTPKINIRVYIWDCLLW